MSETARNEIATIGGEFAVARTSKAGKVVTRTMLGVITSGSRAEKAAAVQYAIERGNFRTLAREVLRVFATELRKAGVLRKDGSIALRVTIELNGRPAHAEVELDLTRVNKADAQALARAAIEAAKADVKGERALYLEALRGLAAAPVDKVETKAVEAAEAPADKVETKAVEAAEAA